MALAGTRRDLLRTALTVPALAAVGATGTGDAAAAPRANTLTLRWLGTAGWELAGNGRHLLVDPWLSRFPATAADGTFDLATPLSVDEEALDRHISAADLVLVTHGHFDHIGDVPHLARRFPTARVVGNETHAHLLTAMGVPDDQLIRVSGGEHLDFGDDLRVRVLRSLHSLDDRHRFIAPGMLVAPPSPPRVVGDLVEGGTLAYQVSLAGLDVLVLGTGNCVEDELAGLRPDVAIIALPPGGATHRFVERAVAALGGPRWVLPSHHDDMSTPLGQSSVAADAVSRFRAAVASASPTSTVVDVEHLTPFVL
jgi:L-ascorbate metabolism protein UlaG (beta-lactamase superfamily)